MTLGELLAAVVDYPLETRVLFQDGEGIVGEPERVEENKRGELVLVEEAFARKVAAL